MKNSKDLTHEDLCNLIANEVKNGATIKSADKYLQAIYKVILRQLELNQRIHFKGFGIFEIKERKSGERLINNPRNNEMQIVYFEPRYSISFRASSNFDYSVNENNFKITTDKNEGFKRKTKKKNKHGKNKFIKNTADLLSKANKRKG